MSGVSDGDDFRPIVRPIEGVSGPGGEIPSTMFIPPRPDIQPSPEPPVRGPRSRRLLGATLAFLLLLGGIGIGWNITRPTPTTPVATVPVGTGSAGTRLDVRQTAGKVEPAVVDINTYARVGAFSGQGGLTPLGAATGMILTSTGEVLTNNHVVDGAYSIEVTIPGRTGTFKATVRGVSPTSDVALIQIQGVTGLPTITAGDPSGLTVGQEVIAIGNALGRGGNPSVTSGVISALDRSITATDPTGSEHLSGLIQSDAPIRPGDSGGPLVDSSGRVIGMITAGSTGNSGGRPSTVGFAIPIDTALGIVEKIRAGSGGPTIFLGQPGFLGIVVRNLDAATAAGLKVTSGVLVVGVEPGSPAAAAGIPANSAITAIDGTPVGSTDALGPALHIHQAGEQVRVSWVDRRGSHTATIRLAAGPAV